MNDHIKISVIIPALNEEKNIQLCLESIKWADEVFIVDSYSTDTTCSIASKYHNVKIAQFEAKERWAEKRNWALSNLPISNEWILMLDADEKVTPELKYEIAEVVNHNPKDKDGYYINFRIYFMGKWIKHCGWYPSWHLRLFKHKLGRYEDIEVNENLLFKGTVGYLKNYLVHQDLKDLYCLIDKHNKYSSSEARIYYRIKHDTDFRKKLIKEDFFGEQPQRKRLLKRILVNLPFRPLFRFIYMYILRLGFLDGKVGFYFCVFYAFYEFCISLKIQELEKKIVDT